MNDHRPRPRRSGTSTQRPWSPRCSISTDDQVAQPSRAARLDGRPCGHPHRPQRRGPCAHARRRRSAARWSTMYPGGREQRTDDIEAGSRRSAAELLADVTATAARAGGDVGGDAGRGVGWPWHHHRRGTAACSTCCSSAGARSPSTTPISASVSRGRIGIAEYVRARAGPADDVVGQPQADGPHRPAAAGAACRATITASHGCSAEPRSRDSHRPGSSA